MRCLVLRNEGDLWQPRVTLAALAMLYSLFSFLHSLFFTLYSHYSWLRVFPGSYKLLPYCSTLSSFPNATKRLLVVLIGQQVESATREIAVFSNWAWSSGKNSFLYSTI
jgi:hypothetical protein